MSIVRVAVLGVGYMGLLHAMKYHAMEEVELVAVVDVRKSRATELADKFGCRSFQSVDQMLDAGTEIDAASIATPTGTHQEIATTLLEAGVHCLVEKPLASNSVAARSLVELAERCERVLLPGHIERFNPAVLSVRQEKPRIQYLRAYRVGPMSFRSIDTDVVFDVMLHDIDICLLLTQEEQVDVQICRAVTSPEGVNDIVNAHLRFGENCYAEFTASRLAIARRRKIRMFTGDEYYSLDCGRGSAMKLEREKYYEGLRALKIFQELGREPTSDDIFVATGATSLASAGDSKYPDALTHELMHFLRQVRGENGEVLVRAVDGVQVIEIAEKILHELRLRDRFDPGMSVRS